MAPMADLSFAVRRGWRWAEFAVLFIGAPLAIALFLPSRLMFVALFAFTAACIVLLHLSGGFEWRHLRIGFGRIRWARALIFALGVGVMGWIILSATRPDYLRPLSPERLRFLALLWLLYPILSALPQELIFRVLFYHRYGELFRNSRVALVANAAVFSFAHLMYWSWIVAGLTFAGGLIFAYSYRRRGFPEAVLLHGLAGNMLFTVGMGVFFWSGNVTRPF